MLQSLVCRHVTIPTSLQSLNGPVMTTCIGFGIGRNGGESFVKGHLGGREAKILLPIDRFRPHSAVYWNAQGLAELEALSNEHCATSV